MARVVLAAGGAVLHDGAVCLVHRPKYDDWSMPKGKLNEGESAEDCALREVLEETGLECELGDELPSVSYTDPKGRPKLVRFWHMTVVRDHGFEPNDETDERRWVELGEAEATVTNDTEVPVLRAVAHCS